MFFKSNSDTNSITKLRVLFIIAFIIFIIISAISFSQIFRYNCNCYRLSYSTFSENELIKFCIKHYTKHAHSIMKTHLAIKCQTDKIFLNSWVESYGIHNFDNELTYEFDSEFCDNTAIYKCYFSSVLVFITFFIVLFFFLIGFYFMFMCTPKNEKKFE